MSRSYLAFVHLFLTVHLDVLETLCVCARVYVCIHETIRVYSPGWCAASTAVCLCAGGEGWPSDRRCVHLPRSARLHPPPYTAAQTGLKNAGSPSVESERVVTERGVGGVTQISKDLSWQKVKYRVWWFIFSQLPFRSLFVKMQLIFCCCIASLGVKGHENRNKERRGQRNKRHV